MLDTGLADRIRRRGVKVVEIAGWKTRGVADFAPRGSVNHHTAGSASGVAPSLNICIYGRTGLAGPLCHVLLGRDLVAYVIAAGRANHAGVGSWKGLSGNRVMHGLEIEHTGYGTSPNQLKVATQIHAAFLEAPGSSRNAAYTCQHFEWAPTRKIDFRDLAPYTASTFRTGVANALKPPAPIPTPPTSRKKDKMLYLVKPDDRAHVFVTDWITARHIWHIDEQTLIVNLTTLAGQKITTAANNQPIVIKDLEQKKLIDRLALTADVDPKYPYKPH